MTKNEDKNRFKVWRPKQRRHFLTTPAAKTRREGDIDRMTDDEVYAEFMQVRFAEQGGKPFCPCCKSDAICCFTAQIRSRGKRDGSAPATVRPKRLMSCKKCGHQFTVLSGTKLAYSKRPLRELLSAIMRFVNHVGGEAALTLSRQQQTDYRTSFILAHKMREAMKGQLSTGPLEGIVQVDGIFFGGVPRKTNKGGMKSIPIIDNGKTQAIVSARSERHTIVIEAKDEASAVSDILRITAKDAIIYADGAPAWNALRNERKMGRVNHNREFSREGITVNAAESYNSRLRRAQYGIHHRIAGPNLIHYGEEMAWREDHRRVSNGEQCAILLSGMLLQPMSDHWRGYWQRMRGQSSARAAS